MTQKGRESRERELDRGMILFLDLRSFVNECIDASVYEHDRVVFQQEDKMKKKKTAGKHSRCISPTYHTDIIM